MRANRGNKKPHSIRRLVGYVKKNPSGAWIPVVFYIAACFFFYVIPVSKQINGNYSEPCQFFLDFYHGGKTFIHFNKTYIQTLGNGNIRRENFIASSGAS